VEALREQPQQNQIESKYLASGESVQSIAKLEGRRVTVTDRRIIEIVQGRTPEGREYENVRSTLFSSIGSVEINATGRTTKYNTPVLLFGLAIILVGVGAIFFGVNSNDIVAIGGLALIGLGAWLSLNAREELPGGILIHLKHPLVDEYSEDTYQLPHTHIDTAHSVVRQIGVQHSS
jgi:hypothetical protein